jgi:WD40 repeat protein
MRDLLTSTFTCRNVAAARRLLGIILVGCSIVGCTVRGDPAMERGMPTAEQVVITEELTDEPTMEQVVVTEELTDKPTVEQLVVTAQPTDEPTATRPTATPAPAAYSGNIVDLQEQGQLETRVSGSGIDELTLQLRNLTGDSLDVGIPAGTYFISSDTAIQNMVVRRSRTIRLTDQNWRTVRLGVACANIDREVPGDETDFEIRRSPVQAELELLMASLEQADTIYDVEQAAIWIVTDNADLERLGTLVRTSLGNPLGSRTIGYDDAAYAMQLVDEAGINIRHRVIWNDRHEIAAGVEDPLLAEWIGQRERRLDVVILFLAHPMLGAAFVPNTQQVVTSACLSGISMGFCAMGEKQVWDSVTGDFLHSFGGQPSGHNNLVFSPDGHLMASTACEEPGDDSRCINGIIQLWDTESWAVAGVLGNHPDYIEAIVFSPDAGSIASKVCVTRQDGLCTASEIWLWDVVAREVMRRYAGFVQFSNSLAFSPNGQLLAAPICVVPDREAYCLASEIWVWDVATSVVIQRLPLDAGWRTATVFTADGDALVAAGALLDDETSLGTWRWQTDSWELASSVPIDEGDLYICSQVAFAPAHEMAAVGLCEYDENWAVTDSNVLIWDLQSGIPIGRIGIYDQPLTYDQSMTYDQPIEEIGISSDGAQVLVRGFDGNYVVLWPVP